MLSKQVIRRLSVKLVVILYFLIALPAFSQHPAHRYIAFKTKSLYQWESKEHVSEITFAYLENSDSILVRPNGHEIQLMSPNGKIYKRYPIPRIANGAGQVFAVKFLEPNLLAYQFDRSSIYLLSDSIYILADTLGHVLSALNIKELPIYSIAERIKYNDIDGDFAISPYTKVISYDKALRSLIVILKPFHNKGSEIFPHQDTPLLYTINIDDGKTTSYPYYRKVNPQEVLSNWELHEFMDFDEENHEVYICNGKTSVVTKINLISKAVPSFNLSSELVDKTTGYHSFFDFPESKRDGNSSYSGLWFDRVHKRLLRSYFLGDTTNKYYGGNGLLQYDLATGITYESLFPFHYARIMRPFQNGVLLHDYHLSRIDKRYSYMRYLVSDGEISQDSFLNTFTIIEEINKVSMNNNSILNAIPADIDFQSSSRLLLVNTVEGCESCLSKLREHLLLHHLEDSARIILIAKDEKEYKAWIKGLPEWSTSKMIFLKEEKAIQYSVNVKFLDYYKITKGTVSDKTIFTSANGAGLWALLFKL